MSETKLISSKVVVETKHIPFRAAGSTINTSLTELVNLLGLKPLSKSSAVELDITFGISDDPGDELIEWMLLVRRAENLTVFNARTRSIWQTAQNWRFVGVATGVVQTLDRQQMEFWNPKIHDMLTLENRRTAAAYTIQAISSIGSTGHVQGIITIRTELIQRSFNGRGMMRKSRRHNR